MRIFLNIFQKFLRLILFRPIFRCCGVKRFLRNRKFSSFPASIIRSRFDNRIDDGFRYRPDSLIRPVSALTAERPHIDDLRLNIRPYRQKT